MKTKQIDIRLDRDPRYVAATARYTALQMELTGLENDLNAAYGGLGTLTQPQDLIRDEATAMLEGATPAPVSNRAVIIKTIDDLTHRIAVLRQAVNMQKSIVDNLRASVGRAIATELLQDHKANVAAIVEAAINLSVAIQAEQELRDTLTEQGVPFSSVLRAMPIHGFNLRDGQSKLNRYLLECHEYGFIKSGDLPDIARDRLPSKAKPTTAPAVQQSSDGWLAAA